MACLAWQQNGFLSRVVGVLIGQDAQLFCSVPWMAESCQVNKYMVYVNIIILGNDLHSSLLRERKGELDWNVLLE